MEPLWHFLIVGVLAFFASLMTFFSGFGLGTILTPIFAIYFPIENAIAMTAIVHLLNNLFKIYLVGKGANFKIVAYFGSMAILGSLVGAFTLSLFTLWHQKITFSLGSIYFNTGWTNIVIAALIISFVGIEYTSIKPLNPLTKGKLLIGGLISGFFGGLSGHQGALRSAFIVQSNISPAAFVGTNAVISFLVDLTRLGIYASFVINTTVLDSLDLISTAVFAALIGAIIGKLLLKKLKLNLLKNLVGFCLIVFSILLGLGIIG